MITDTRILLVGRTGHGKSSTANTIIGKNVFEVSASSKSVTKKCKWSHKCRRFGKVVEVVDTPGFFDTDCDHSAVHKELLKALALSTPGFHVIAFVLMKGRFTEEMQKTQDLFFEWFGPGVEKFACIILTDTNSEDAKREYIYEDPHKKLAELVMTCNDNVVPLNNVALDELKDSQIRRLFEVVESIKENNGNQHFSNVAFQLAEAYIHSKFPKELTQESIVILQDAGLRMQVTDDRIKYLDQIFAVNTETGGDRRNKEGRYRTGTDSNIEDKTTSTPARAAFVNEQNEQSASGDGSGVGNLKIFDKNSLERISNTHAKRVHFRQDVPTCGSENPSVSEAHASEDYCDSSDSETLEVPGILDSQSNSNISQDFLHANQCQNQSGADSDIMLASASYESEEQIHRGKQKPSSRRNRKIDSESVRYEIPADPIDDFKDKINKCENGDEELHGLSGYFEKAWRYCKRKLSSCTLL